MLFTYLVRGLLLPASRLVVGRTLIQLQGGRALWCWKGVGTSLLVYGYVVSRPQQGAGGLLVFSWCE